MAVAMLGPACARTPAVDARPALPVGPTFRVLTYNVNFGIAGDPETIAAIRDAHADLALLQETNRVWEHTLRAALSTELPHMVFRNRGGAGGFAVLSRVPLAETELVDPSGDGWFGAARVVVDTPFGRMQALSVHLHPPVSESGSFVSGHFTTPSVRIAEMKSFFAHLVAGIPALIAGDFNEEEDGGVMQFLTEKGMLSALARYAPDQPTWRWPTVVGTLRRQLDHVVYDPHLDVVSAEIRQAGRSDHLPVIAVVTSARVR